MIRCGILCYTYPPHIPHYLPFAFSTLSCRPNIEATQKSKKQKKSSKSSKKKVQGRQQQSQQVEDVPQEESRYVGCFASESSFLGEPK